MSHFYSIVLIRGGNVVIFDRFITTNSAFGGLQNEKSFYFITSFGCKTYKSLGIPI